MGTFKASRLNDDEICARYVGGESRGIIGLRAKMPDAFIVEVLLHNGITLRTPSEVKAMTGQARNVANRRRPRR